MKNLTGTAWAFVTLGIVFIAVGVTMSSWVFIILGIVFLNIAFGNIAIGGTKDTPKDSPVDTPHTDGTTEHTPDPQR